MTSTRRPGPGAPYPLGATLDHTGVNFALFSAHATKVELCLFDSSGQQEIERLELPDYTDEVWHGHLAGVSAGTVYGYRVHGPYDPPAGHRFNPHKLLLDPYARAHIGHLQWDDACFGYTVGAEGDDLTFDTRDSAPFVEKSVVVDPTFAWRDEAVWLSIPWPTTVFYELHLRGFTMRHPDVPTDQRGTFAGLSTQRVIDYIRALGVTSVELLPVHAFVNDRYLVERGLTNFWGYNSIGFFAPDVRYAADPANSLREFKEMVARLHDAGLEVILDVVYNHTAEGSELGPTLSFKGIDNASYYRLVPDNRRLYINDTGTGNTLNLTHPRVIQMVTDSLRYWAAEMHIDGFRFDLGTILARERDGFDENSAFLIACRQDPVLAKVKMIAEPWDCGPGGYHVGGFPPGWAEWNDKFRDAVRDFWRGAAPPGAISPRLCASANLFNNRGRRPWASVNFVTAHDGFTLNDLVSYTDKHNEGNCEDNNDGTSHNRSQNFGVEGPSEDDAINAMRRRQVRNFLATLLLSQGTPLLLAGDERSRTQGGNNNAYAQDNDISWVEWESDRCDLIEFVRRLICLRRTYPALRRNHFLSGAVDEARGTKEVAWIHPSGGEIEGDQWNSLDLRCFGMLIDGRAGADPASADEATLLLILNAHETAVSFTMPAPDERLWSVLLDTSSEPSTAASAVGPGAVLEIAERSVMLLEPR